MKSFRSEVHALRSMAEVLENNQHIERPEFVAGGSKAYPTSRFSFHVWEHTFPLEGRKEALENAMLEIMNLFPECEWKANSPENNSYDQNYYVLKTEWMGATLDITTHRSAVCELVVVREDEEEVEVQDPDLIAEATKDIPTVKQIVKTPVKQWECNKTLAEAVDPLLKKIKEQANA